MTDKTDIDLGPAVEAGAKSLYLSSPPGYPQSDDDGWWWKHLTPAIRNRWRRRFKTAYSKALAQMTETEWKKKTTQKCLDTVESFYNILKARDARIAELELLLKEKP